MTLGGMANMQMPVNPIAHLMPYLTVGNIVYFLAAFVVNLAELFGVAGYLLERFRKISDLNNRMSFLIAAVVIVMLLGSDITWLAVNMFLVESMFLVFAVIACGMIYVGFWSGLLGLVL